MMTMCDGASSSRVQKTVFVIDTYSKYEDNSGVRKIYMINDILYCIRETTMEWGSPLIPVRVDDSTNPRWYRTFDTYEEAEDFVNYLKRINR